MEVRDCWITLAITAAAAIDLVGKPGTTGGSGALPGSRFLSEARLLSLKYSRHAAAAATCSNDRSVVCFKSRTARPDAILAACRPDTVSDWLFHSSALILLPFRKPGRQENVGRRIKQRSLRARGHVGGSSSSTSTAALSRSSKKSKH